MLESIGIPLADLTAPTLLGVVVLLVLLGRIVPRSILLAKEKEAERWRLAYEAEREARIETEAQTKELLELAKTTHSFITATFANSERIRRSGEPDAAVSKA